MPDLVEAYVGEYASGKSEIAINRALRWQSQVREVTLVDLDLVEPVYTLRPLKAALFQRGLSVIAWDTKETMGLGEAGMILHPQVKGVLRRSGVIVLDVGYGVYGSEILNLVDGLPLFEPLHVNLVVNTCRPMTADVQAIVAECRRFSRINNLINNTNLGHETTPEVVCKGAEIIAQAASVLGVPFLATVALTHLVDELKGKSCLGEEIWPLERFMPGAFW